MLKKGFLSVLLMFFCLGSPMLMAEDSAKTVDEVVVWWEKYGKYWDDVVADSGGDDSIFVALNDE